MDKTFSRPNQLTARMVQRSTHFAFVLAVAEDRSFKSDKLSQGIDMAPRTTKIQWLLRLYATAG